MTDDGRELEVWLRRMSWALAGVPEVERDDIVAETRAHISERVAQGTPMTAALAEFEAPESYARHFVEECELAGAVGSQRPAQMMGAVFRRVHRSAVAAIAFLAVAVLGTIAFVATLTAIVKILDPVHAGLWRGSKQMFLGVISDPVSARELLGNWLYPAAALSVALAVLIGRAVLVWAVKRMARAG